MNRSGKKAGRRKSSLRGLDVPAAILVQLTEISDNISGAYDSSLLATQTAKVLSLVTNHSCERKALMQKASSGLSIILKVLKVADSFVIVSDVISLLHILIEHDHAAQLVRSGVVSAVMVSLSDTYRSTWSSDNLLMLHIHVLNKLTTNDKRFAVKARLSGILPIIVGLLKKFLDDQAKLIAVLKLLQTLSTSSVNADCIGKLGCISTLVKLLTKNQKDYIVLKHCMNTLTSLLKIKANAIRPSVQTCVKQLVVLHEQLHKTDSQSRHVLLRKKVLQCLKACISKEANLQAFHKSNGLQVLYTTAIQSSEGGRKSSRSIASLSCSILRKCITPVPLPLPTLDSPYMFPLPYVKEEDLASGSSSKSISSEYSTVVASSDRVEEAIEENGTEEATSTSSRKIQMPLPNKSRHLSDSDLTDSCNCESQRNCHCSYNDKTFIAGGNMNSLNHCEDEYAESDCCQVANDHKSKIDIDLALFSKYFPELSQTSTEKQEEFPSVITAEKEEAMPSSDLTSQSNLAQSAQELIQESSEITSVNPPVVVVPTGLQTTSSSTTDSYSNEQSEHARNESKETLVNSTTTFVEIPTPQLVKHTSPEKQEPLYTKTVSVDRKLYLSDIARLTNPETLLNRIVFDLDLLTTFSQPPSSVCLEEDANHKPPSSTSLLGAETREVHPNLETAKPAKPGENRVDPVSKNLEIEVPSTASAPQSGDLKSRSFDSATRELERDLVNANAEMPLPHGESEANVHQMLDELEWDNFSLDPVVTTAVSSETGSVEKSATESDISLMSLPHLEFESRFESGNLRKAIQIRQYEYDLLLNPDISTNHHHQWFYFKVAQTEPRVTYRFNIINCEKPNSQFNYGMQPVMFSTTAFNVSQQGWIRAGTKVSYYSNNFVVGNTKEGPPSRRKKTYYTMTFSIVFEYEKDTCYFAYHYPYSYSMLLRDLELIQEDCKERDFYYHRQTLCTSLCGNDCPLVTISSRKSSEDEKEDKKYVVISARVHPGESNSSWIMKGLLNHLTSNHPNAQALRDKFVFKIIPMLNPDGVIHGSHRCSLSGDDLNRKWITPSPHLHPTIYCTKSLLQWLVATNRQPEVFCDFHGHSRRKNIFMYGCKDPLGSCTEQVLPRLLDKLAPFFSYSSCSFVVEKSKEATARVVVWKELGVARSYTMESTYCGTDQGQNKGKQIDTGDLEEMGTLFCAGLQRLEESTENGFEDASKDSAEYMSCHSDSSDHHSSGDEGSESSHSVDELDLGTILNVASVSL